MSDAHDRIVLTLEGENANQGLPLGSLESFIDRFSRALVDFDRSQRGHETRRAGRRTAREEQILAFRVVRLSPGSAVIELEPVAGRGDEQALATETLAVSNLRAFLDVVEDVDTPINPDVTQSLEAARRALGRGGRIGVVLAGDPRHERKMTIDEERVEELARRRPARQQLVKEVSGQLTMVDIEPPFRVAIRSASGLKWNCRYHSELEEEVRALLKRNVVARGAGVRVTSRRGYFEIEQIESLQDFQQTELFTTERKPLEAILRRKGAAAPQGWRVFSDPDWHDDAESDTYAAVLAARDEGAA